MTASSGQRRPPTGSPALPSYPRPACPVPVGRAALGWRLALACWFAGSVLGQLLHGPAAVAADYRYGDDWSLPVPMTVMLFGLVALFLASLSLPLRDGSRWARSLLTVLAVPLAATLVWQVGRCVFAGLDDVGALSQGVPCLVALCLLPGAVSLMYGRDVRSHYRATE